jgi:hypothetical protein
MDALRPVSGKDLHRRACRRRVDMRVGLAHHGLLTALTPRSQGWRERQLEREMQRLRRQRRGPATAAAARVAR